MRLRNIVQGLHPWYRSRLASIAIWPARQMDGGGWIALLAYAPSADPAPTRAAESAEIAKAAFPLELPVAEGPALECELTALQAHEELGHLVLLRLLPTAVPTALSRGNGYTAPGWLIITHAGSEREREEWLRAIQSEDRDPSTA